MISNSYALTPVYGAAFTGNVLPPVLCDGDIQLERDSRARSGVYFETIATELENVAANSGNRIVMAELERLTDELLYLQKRYFVIKKPSIIEQLDEDS